MGNEIIRFGNIETEKRKFYHRKNLVLLDDIDIDSLQYLVWFLLVKKIMKVLLVTKIIMNLKLNHYG